MHYRDNIVNCNFGFIFIVSKTLEITPSRKARCPPPRGFFFHPFLQSFLFGDALVRGILPHVLSDFHRTATCAKAAASQGIARRKIMGQRDPK
jgi:hypothetical protein